MELIEKYRKSCLESIEDLKQKLETNEKFSESEQDVSTLSEISDRLDEILGCWYY